ncbi:hypothetical protein F2981_12570 [Sinorhizobium meliloti]|nr:hypothetical protein [Sinorhizobium meliloti]
MRSDRSTAPRRFSDEGQFEGGGRPSLGIVGSRNASVSGREVRGDDRPRRRAAGYVITSGLARGIDTAAHRASLRKARSPCSRWPRPPLPPENLGLLQEIVSGEGWRSARCPSAGNRAPGLPGRNRLVAGIQPRFAIVEAASRSGH